MQKWKNIELGRRNTASTKACEEELDNTSSTNTSMRNIFGKESEQTEKPFLKKEQEIALKNIKKHNSKTTKHMKKNEAIVTAKMPFLSRVESVAEEYTTQSISSRRSGFKSEWRINDSRLDSIKPDESQIHTIRNESLQSGREDEYFIKKNNGFYQVKYDRANQTWRVEPPNKVGMATYRPAVRLNIHNTWELHGEVGLRGAGLMKVLGMFRRNYGKITIGGYTFNQVRVNKEKHKIMTGISQMYFVDSKSPARIVSLSKLHEAGKMDSDNEEYNYLDDLTLDAKMDIYNADDSSHKLRGVLSVKINAQLTNVNYFDIAKQSRAWGKDASKATNVVLLPQTIYLKGRPGECLPAAILMGRALETGRAQTFSERLMSIYGVENVESNSLYRSLSALHEHGNASKFNALAKPFASLSLATLESAESSLFKNTSSSVRVDIPGHTMLLSKVISELREIRYVFFDPNYGVAYFDKYKHMLTFFKRKIHSYAVDTETINFYGLDYSNIHLNKVRGQSLDDIIDAK